MKIRSLARDRGGFRVAASPFNPVKLELALCLCMAAVLWLVVEHLQLQWWHQLLLLAGYSAAATIWLVIHTRRIARRCAEQHVNN